MVNGSEETRNGESGRVYQYLGEQVKLLVNPPLHPPQLFLTFIVGGATPVGRFQRTHEPNHFRTLLLLRKY